MSAQYTPCDADQHDNVDTSFSEFATGSTYHVALQCVTHGQERYTHWFRHRAQDAEVGRAPHDRKLNKKTYNFGPIKASAEQPTCHRSNYRAWVLKKITASMMRARTPTCQRTPIEAQNASPQRQDQMQHREATRGPHSRT